MEGPSMNKVVTVIFVSVHELLKHSFNYLTQVEVEVNR